MRSRRFVILILVAVAAAAGWYYYTQQSAANSGVFVLSGTIEATEINLPSVRGGQVLQVFAGEGDTRSRRNIHLHRDVAVGDGAFQLAGAGGQRTLLFTTGAGAVEQLAAVKVHRRATHEVCKKGVEQGAVV